MTTHPACELCNQTGAEAVWSNDRCRVVLVGDIHYPGFCRVIWGRHAKEMTDLAADDRQHLMAVVWQVESAVREAMMPDKINLACLGNLVPHVHWHVIPRFVDDVHFPSPVWAAIQRPPVLQDLATRSAMLPLLREAILRNTAQLSWQGN